MLGIFFLKNKARVMRVENNYLSYLKWHGDLSFQEYSFNEIDNIILSELAYFRFDHIIPCDDKIITIKAAYDKLERMNKNIRKPGYFPLLYLLYKELLKVQDLHILCYLIM